MQYLIMRFFIHHHCNQQRNKNTDLLYNKRMKLLSSPLQVMLLLLSLLFTITIFSKEVDCSIHTRKVDILNNYKHKQKLEQQQQKQKQSNNNNNNININDDNDVQELYITQNLDHFNAANSMYTFQQRYFYSDRYINKKVTTNNNNNNYNNINLKSKSNTTFQQLAFLCVGGEGPYLDKSVLIDSPHCTGDMLYVAERMMNSATKYLNIHLFALEHRYYGESYPQNFPTNTNYNNDNNNNNNNNSTLSPVTNEHLIYLSSRQSLADLAHFISQPDYSNYKWIIFGASYPGVLAAWSRFHYPHLIHAAISNSAPIQSMLDMAVYNNHVSNVLSNTNVGGSELCLQIYKNGHEQLANEIIKNSTYITQKLNICNNTALNDIKNVQLLIGSGILYPGTQENDPSCTDPLCNINKKCNALINYYNTTTSCCNKEMNALIEITTKFNKMKYNNDNDNNNDKDDYNDLIENNYNNVKHDWCYELDWKGTLDYISDPILGMNEGLRSWLWQTCTEFGFYQTCNINSTCPFAQGYHPLIEDLELCQIAFNISAKSVSNLIQDTNIWSGGWKLHNSGISRIVSITGTVDPWSELAFEKSNYNNNNTNNIIKMPVYQVKDASHHFWTHPIKVTDNDDINNARNFIYETVQQFLHEEDDKSNNNYHQVASS